MGSPTAKDAAYKGWVDAGRPSANINGEPHWGGWPIADLRQRDADLGNEYAFAPPPPVGRQTGPEALVTERGKTHGDWTKQARCAQDIKKIIRDHFHVDMNYNQLEALEMIAVKMSRILCGNAFEPDHWDDISGYAVLGKQGHKK